MKFLSLGLAFVAAQDRSVNPLGKVVQLLKDMKTSVQEEMNRDMAISKEMQCYCQRNRNEKGDNIALLTAELQRIKRLDGLKEKLSGLIASGEANKKKLAGEIKATETEIEETEKKRQKELAEFQKWNNAQTEYIAALNGAITTLKKFQGLQVKDGEKTSKALLQQSSTELKSVEKSLHLLPSTSDVQQVTSLLAELKTNPYASSSGTIFGILNQMLETMTSDQGERTNESATSQAAMLELLTQKKAILKAKRAEEDSCLEELSNNKNKLSTAKREHREADEQRTADETFLKEMEPGCASDLEEARRGEERSLRKTRERNGRTLTSSDGKRSKLMQAEMTAIDETINILDTDEARVNSKRTLSMTQAGFLQLQNSAAASKQSATFKTYTRSGAAAILRLAALKSSDPRLALVATTTQLAAFTKVLKAIEDLIAALKQEQADEVPCAQPHPPAPVLKQEQADEVVHKDSCTKNMNNNDQAKADSVMEMDSIQAKIANFEAMIQAGEAKEEEVKGTIKQTEIDFAVASRERQERNQAYSALTAEHAVTQKILGDAIKRLKAFYDKQGALLQQSESESPGEKPRGLVAGEYKATRGGGAVALLQDILKDSEETIAIAAADEQAQQGAYETLITETTATLARNQVALAACQDDLANNRESLSESEADAKDNLAHQDALMAEAKALQAECQFLLTNFDMRQTKRSEEMEALAQAVSILKGADLDASMAQAL